MLFSLKGETFLQGIPSVIYLAYGILGTKSETHHFTFLFCSLKMFLFQDHMFIMLLRSTGQHYFECFLDTHEIPQITIQELQLHYIHLVNKKPFVRGLQKLVWASLTYTEKAVHLSLHLLSLWLMYSAQQHYLSLVFF